MGVQKAQSDLEADISLNFVGDEEPKVRSEHVQVEEHIIFTLRTETIEGVNKRNLLVLFLHDQVNDSYAWSESKVLQVGSSCLPWCMLFSSLSLCMASPL